MGFVTLKKFDPNDPKPLRFKLLPALYHAKKLIKKSQTYIDDAVREALRDGGTRKPRDTKAAIQIRKVLSYTIKAENEIRRMEKEW